MTKKRFTIEIVDDENWLIEDTETGLDYNPIDGTSKVLNGLINLLNEYYEENKRLSKENWELENFRYSVFQKMEELNK